MWKGTSGKLSTDFRISETFPYLGFHLKVVQKILTFLSDFQFLNFQLLILKSAEIFFCICSNAQSTSVVDGFTMHQIGFFRLQLYPIPKCLYLSLGTCRRMYIKMWKCPMSTYSNVPGHRLVFEKMCSFFKFPCLCCFRLDIMHEFFNYFIGLEFTTHAIFPFRILNCLHFISFIHDVFVYKNMRSDHTYFISNSRLSFFSLHYHHKQNW